MDLHPKSFADYKAEGYLWITFAKGEYQPQLFLEDSVKVWGELVEKSPTVIKDFTLYSCAQIPANISSIWLKFLE